MGKDKEMAALEEKIRKLTDQAKETDYAHKMELLEKDRQAEQIRAEARREIDAEMVRQREKYESELEKVREKYEKAQAKIQEILNKQDMQDKHIIQFFRCMGVTR